MNLEYFAHKIARSYQEDRVREAQTARLLREISVNRPRLRQRIGEVLVSTGTWLQRDTFNAPAAMNLCPDGQSCG